MKLMPFTCVIMNSLLTAPISVSGVVVMMMMICSVFSGLMTCCNRWKGGDEVENDRCAERINRVLR